MTREIPLGQTRFYVENDGSVRLSKRVTEWGFGLVIDDFLKERAAWKEIDPKGKLLLVEMDSPKANGFVLEREQWQKLESVDIGSRKKFSKPFAASVVVFPESLNKTSVSLHSHIFRTAAGLVKKDGGGFFVLEKCGDDEDEGWRKDLLKDLDLVKINFYTSQKKSHQYLVWSSRFRKEAEEREGIDVTSKDHPKYWFVLNLWKEMIGVYHKQGYKLKDAEKSELLERLKSSKNLHFDIELIKQGFGLDLEARCGCQWHVSMRGDWERIQNCTTPGCDGIPTNPKESSRPEVFYLNKKIETNIRCYDCGEGETTLERRYSQIVKDEKERDLNLKGRALLLEITYCPHCGSNATRKFKVDLAQIRT